MEVPAIAKIIPVRTHGLEWKNGEGTLENSSMQYNMD
jgi:hypothetical protein